MYSIKVFFRFLPDVLHLLRASDLFLWSSLVDGWWTWSLLIFCGSSHSKLSPNGCFGLSCVGCEHLFSSFELSVLEEFLLFAVENIWISWDDIPIFVSYDLSSGLAGQPLCVFWLLKRFCGELFLIVIWVWFWVRCCHTSKIIPIFSTIQVPHRYESYLKY